MPASRPLSELNQVDWASLHHAYGEATDIPDFLRAAGNGDLEALGEFYGNLCHQGSVYPATAAAVPFLIGLLQGGHTEVLHLLGCMAQGSGYLRRHEGFYPPEEVAAPAYQKELEREAGWVSDTHAAVAAGAQVYIECLSAADPADRALAAFLLWAVMESHWVPSVGPIVKRLRHEDNPVVRAALAYALGNAPPERQRCSRVQLVDLIVRGEITRQPPAPPVLRALYAVFEPPDDGTPETVLPRLTAALALIEQQGLDVEEIIPAFLLDCLSQHDLQALYALLPWETSVTDELALGAARLDQAEVFVPAFLARSVLPSNPNWIQEAETAREWALAALWVAHPGREAPFMPPVADVLRHLLTQTTDQLGFDWNMREALKYVHGLPTTPEGLWAWLAAHGQA